MLRETGIEQNQTIYGFGSFRLDAAQGVLFADDAAVKLTPKAVQTLILLVERGGAIVTKEEFFETVWAGTFVEDAVLSFNISQLRKTLAQFEPTTKFIETVPKRGFRFLPPVREIIVESADGENVFERRRAEQILIEETIETDAVALETREITAVNRKQLAPAGNQPFATRGVYFALAIVLILSVAGFIVWSRNNATADAVPTAAIKSIAVLPLKPIAANETDKVLSLGLADALIMKLGASQKIAVRSINSVAAFAEAEFDALAVGQKLQAGAVLDGSFQRSDNRLRVSARLLRVADGKQFWAGTFDETEADIFKLQDLLSAQVAKSLRWNLTADEQENLIKRPTENVEAYEKYLRGRYLWNQRTSKNLLKAIEEFEYAARLDPNFALAYVGLADCYALLSVYDERPPLEAFPRAKENAEIALKLNPNSAEARTTLAFVSYRFEWNWAAAEREFRRAIELNPNYPTAHHWFAEFLTASRRFDEAVSEYRKALEIDPTSLIINTDFGYGLFLARRYDESVNQLRTTVNLNPNFPLAFYCLADSLTAQKREKESIEVFIKWLALIETDAAEIAKMQRAFGAHDFAEFKKSRLEWIEAEAQKNNFTKVDVARFYAEANGKNIALDWLENAARERAADLIFIHAHPGFDNLRGEPRFQAILRATNLPD